MLFTCLTDFVSLDFDWDSDSSLSFLSLSWWYTVLQWLFPTFLWLVDSHSASLLPTMPSCSYFLNNSPTHIQTSSIVFFILRWAYIHLTEGDMGMLPCWCFFQCGDELNENLKLRCFGDLSLMFVFFTLWCSVKWNNLWCWSFLFYLSQI